MTAAFEFVLSLFPFLLLRCTVNGDRTLARIVRDSERLIRERRVRVPDEDLDKTLDDVAAAVPSNYKGNNIRHRRRLVVGDEYETACADPSVLYATVDNSTTTLDSIECACDDESYEDVDRVVCLVNLPDCSMGVCLQEEDIWVFNVSVRVFVCTLAFLLLLVDHATWDSWNAVALLRPWWILSENNGTVHCAFHMLCLRRFRTGVP